jgi:hypothetical protein
VPWLPRFRRCSRQLAGWGIASAPSTSPTHSEVARAGRLNREAQQISSSIRDFRFWIVNTARCLKPQFPWMKANVCSLTPSMSRRDLGPMTSSSHYPRTITIFPKGSEISHAVILRTPSIMQLPGYMQMWPSPQPPPLTPSRIGDQMISDIQSSLWLQPRLGNKYVHSNMVNGNEITLG